MATTSERARSGRKPGQGGTRDNLGVMVAVAAGGAALGVLAMLGRKVVVQAPTALAGDWDEALAAEHAAVMKLFDALEATEDRNTKRSILLAQLKHALGKHALEEENVIYPALRDAGEAVGADELNAEHGYVKQYLYELHELPNDDPSFLAKVRDFRSHIESHVREEEDVLFPRLKASLDDVRNRHLTRMMNKEGFKLA